MAAKRDYTSTPEYWSCDPATFDMWVTELGYAAAGKLMVACAVYFLHGTEPDEIKLTKSARNIFEGERPRLDRRRALALKAKRDAGKKAGANAGNQPERNVENSKSQRKVGRKPAKSCGVFSKKSSGESGRKQASTCDNAQARQGTVISLNLNHNPQTPTPSGGARALGVVSTSELAEMQESGLAYDSPNAYGMTDGTMTVAGG